MKKIDGDYCHELLLNKIEQKLKFNENNNFYEWRDSVKNKFYDLIGIDRIKENSCDPNFMIEKKEQKKGYTQIRFVFESEIGATVPCYLLIPNTGKKKYPVAITLQGHSSGFHNSIGEPKDESENEYALGRGQFALQAIKNGYIALAIEQRAMGERRSQRHSFDTYMCSFPSLTAFELGRTVIGERIWDISKAIDVISNFTECDMDRLFITGNSGGGTISYYAACYDERIKLSVPSCSFCSYKESIMKIFHCPCNYIPHMYEWFEMQDLACLIAPRKIIIVAGKEDHIFPIKGVKDGFETIKKIYLKANVEANATIVETPKGHYWCEDIVWQSINNIIEKI